MAKKIILLKIKNPENQIKMEEIQKMGFTCINNN